LVERLESLIANGKPLPLTRNAIIDRDAALNLIDELRVAVPEEVRAAKRINTEGERIIEKAQEEAERIVARAQEQAAFLIEERGLTEAAAAESRRMIAIAGDEADEVRRGADEYAAGVLAGLEADVTRTLTSIERGIAMLDERRAAQARTAGSVEGPKCSARRSTSVTPRSWATSPGARSQAPSTPCSSSQSSRSASRSDCSTELSSLRVPACAADLEWRSARRDTPSGGMSTSRPRASFRPANDSRSCSAARSARSPKTETRNQSVSSIHSPVCWFFVLWLTATLNWVTGRPVGV